MSPKNINYPSWFLPGADFCRTSNPIANATSPYFHNKLKFNAVILKISLTPQKLMQKRRSTPGDKWEVEMEVDTRRKTSVTFSAKFNGGNSAEFNGRTDGRTNERTDGRTNGRNFRQNCGDKSISRDIFNRRYL